MEKRNVQITIEQAKEWLKNDQLKDIALEAFPELIEKTLPKTWEELERISGFYVDEYSEMDVARNCHTSEKEHRNIFATVPQAESSISCAMYSQLIEAYKDVSIEKFIDIAKEYEPNVIPILELFFAENAKAAFYFGLLSQLRDVYRNGWIPNYNDTSFKYVIRFRYNKLEIETVESFGHFLSFKDSKTANLFLENFGELILKIKPLMS